MLSRKLSIAKSLPTGQAGRQAGASGGLILVLMVGLMVVLVSCKTKTVKTDVGKSETTKSDITSPQEKRTSELIKQLDDHDYQTREKAQRQIVRIGTNAVPFVERAQNDNNPEIRFRANLIQRQWAILKPNECAMVPQIIWDKVYESLTLKTTRSELITHITWSIYRYCKDKNKLTLFYRELLKDTCRRELIRYLAEANDLKSIPYLKQHLAETKRIKDEMNRPNNLKYEIAVALVWLGDKSGAEELMQNLAHSDGFIKWINQFTSICTEETEGSISSWTVPGDLTLLFRDMQKIIRALQTGKEAKTLARKVLDKAISEFNQVLTGWKNKYYDIRQVLWIIENLVSVGVGESQIIEKRTPEGEKEHNELFFDRRYLKFFVPLLVNILRETRQNTSVLLKKAEESHYNAKLFLATIIRSLEQIAFESFFMGHLETFGSRKSESKLLEMMAYPERAKRKREEWKKLELSILINKAIPKIEMWWETNKDKYPGEKR